MSVQWQERVVLVCDLCGDGWWRLDDVPWFATVEHARAFAVDRGWAVAAGREVCADCALAEACAARGHRWGRWRRFGPFPTVGGPARRGQVRYCRVCTCAQWEPFVSPGSVIVAVDREPSPVAGSAPSPG